jgi:hypothetical protein
MRAKATSILSNFSRSVHMSSPRHKVLTKDSINQRVVAAEYAVRGALAIKAEDLRTELEEDPGASARLGFDTVIHANIGNPQQLGQKGLTFLRQASLDSCWVAIP